MNLKRMKSGKALGPADTYCRLPVDIRKYLGDMTIERQESFGERQCKIRCPERNCGIAGGSLEWQKSMLEQCRTCMRTVRQQ